MIIKQTTKFKVLCSCDRCGKLSERYLSVLKTNHSEHTFCSNLCQNQFEPMKKRGEAAWNWAPRVEKKCLECGKIIHTTQWYKNTKKYCSYECAGKVNGRKNIKNMQTAEVAKKRTETIKQNGSLKGSNNPSYIDGRSRALYGADFYNKEFKTSIRKRDRFQCMFCGKNAHEIHHIDYNKQNNDPRNLITLCHKCHCATNWKRGFWSSFIISTTMFVNKSF